MIRELRVSAGGTPLVRGFERWWIRRVGNGFRRIPCRSAPYIWPSTGWPNDSGLTFSLAPNSGWEGVDR